MSLQASIEIAATPERIFAYLTQPELVKSWQPDLVESSPLPAGGLRVGTRQQAIVEEFGRRWKIETVVVDMAPNRHIAFDMEGPTASVHSEYLLVQNGDRTRVEHTAAMITPLGFMRVLWPLPLVKGLFRRKMQSRLKLLRKRVEEAAELTQAAKPK